MASRAVHAIKCSDDEYKLFDEVGEYNWNTGKYEYEMVFTGHIRKDGDTWEARYDVHTFHNDRFIDVRMAIIDHVKSVDWVDVWDSYEEIEDEDFYKDNVIKRWIGR